ncbi:hypothetical protein K8I61_01165 [bacterium]|nr:hypothetical protein [bacterium]
MKYEWTKIPMLFAMVAVLAFGVSCFREPEGGEPLSSNAYNSELCDQCLEASPEPESLDISLPGDDKIGALAVGDLATLYDQTVDITRGLNFWILGHLSFLDEILSYPPSSGDEDTCVWGPFIPSGLSPVEARFVMTKLSPEEFVYSWDERLKNTDGEFKPVWGGEITPSTDTARRGVGNLFIDFTTAQELDPTWDASGILNVTYDTYTDGRKIDIDFSEFQPEDAEYAVDAEYRYHNHADNSGEFRFTYFADIDISDDPAKDELEVINQETFWLGTGEGYSTQTVSGGDITGTTFGPVTLDRWEIHECWDETFRRVFYEARIVDTDGNSFGDGTTEGDPADCVEI